MATRRPRRGLSELLGATIVVAAVVAAAISAALVIDKASARAARLLESAADPGYEILVYPIVDSGRLLVYLAPTEPGATYGIIAVDVEGNSWYTQATANGTSLIAEVIAEYDCRPVYVIAVDSEGRLHWYVSLRDPRVPGEPRDPRLFTCYQANDSRITLIPGLVEGEVVPVIALYEANKTIVMEPFNGSLQRVLITGYLFDDEINNHWIFMCNLTVQVYNQSEEAWVPINIHNNCEDGHLANIQLYPGIVLEIRLAKDAENGRAIFYGVIHGPYDAYLLQADLYARLRDQFNRLIHVGNPYYTLLVVPQAAALNETKYSISGRRYDGGVYVYTLTSRFRGLMLVRDLFLIGYIDQPILRVSILTLRLNFTLIAAARNLYETTAIPLGEVQPGAVLHVELSRVAEVEGYVNTLIDEVINYSQPPARLEVRSESAARVYSLHYGNNRIEIEEGGELYLVVDAGPTLSFSPALYYRRTTDGGYDLYFTDRIGWTLERAYMPSLASANTPLLIRINYEGKQVAYVVAIASAEIHSILQAYGLTRGPLINGSPPPGLQYCIMQPETGLGEHDPPTAPCLSEHTRTSPMMVSMGSVETKFTVNVNGTVYIVRIPAWAQLVYLP